MINIEKIECCVLVADVIINDLKTSYSYIVPIEKIEEFKQNINDTFNYFGNFCLRVYISGFIITTSGFIYNKEKIIEQVQSETTRINKIKLYKKTII